MTAGPIESKQPAPCHRCKRVLPLLFVGGAGRGFVGWYCGECLDAISRLRTARRRRLGLRPFGNEPDPGAGEGWRSP